MLFNVKYFQKYLFIEINRINEYKTPRDKLIAIINCCKLISSMIWKAKSNKKPTGADDLWSVLIYILIKAKPEKIASNLAYIGDYRERRLKGESEYYLITFKGGIKFIENL